MSSLICNFLLASSKIVDRAAQLLLYPHDQDGGEPVSQVLHKNIDLLSLHLELLRCLFRSPGHRGGTWEHTGGAFVFIIRREDHDLEMVSACSSDNLGGCHAQLTGLPRTPVMYQTVVLDTCANGPNLLGISLLIGKFSHDRITHRMLTERLSLVLAE